MKKKHGVMESIPVNPNVVFDPADQEKFRKRVSEVIAKVETDPGSAHLFEPASDVIRKRCIKDRIRKETAEGIFTEYQIIREHARTRFSLMGQLEVLEYGVVTGEKEGMNAEAELEKTFFETAEKLLGDIYGEVE